jgi:acetoin:2,6-dichlorophenolindophenol oxidoreductase subunit alpha
VLVTDEAVRPEKKTPSADIAELVRWYADLLLIRRVEERLISLFADGEVPGFIHLGIGQEAVSVGIMSALTPADTIASTHRGHGHALAKGMSLNGFFSELMGKENGICRGRGGSMHVADMSIGMLGANGIVGAGISIALGSALAHKVLERNAIAVAFFGDGALAEGILHECLNMAALMKLPLLFVCENNGWSEFSPTAKQVAFSLERLADAHAIPYGRVEGNDVLAVSARARESAALIRAGNGPRILECTTDRVRGHYEGDNQKYRSARELSSLSTNDPIRVVLDHLANTIVPNDEIKRISEATDARIEDAIAAARSATAPEFSRALGDVYTERGV